MNIPQTIKVEHQPTQPAPTSRPAPSVKVELESAKQIKVKSKPVQNESAKPMPAKMKEEPKEPVEKPIAPPPKVEPSGLIMALSRLAELEEQLEYAFAKHVQLTKTQEKLRAQTKVLKKLPVGIDAIREELDAAQAEAQAKADAETAAQALAQRKSETETEEKIEAEAPRETQ